MFKPMPNPKTPSPALGRWRKVSLGVCAVAAGLVVLAAGVPGPHGLQVPAALAQQKAAPKKAAKPKTPARAPDHLTAQQVAKRVQAFYRKTADFEAHFTQTYTDIAAGSKKHSHGRVYFKKPGMMRWDYYDAKHPRRRDKVLVSDGKAFWIYEFRFKQVFKQCLKDSQLPTSLKFLMGEGNLLQDFNVSLTKNSTPAHPELKLVPKHPTSKYKELRFGLDPKTFEVKRTVIYDPYGNTNEVVFHHILVNRNLPKSGFEFKPPKGARLLNPQMTCQ